MQIIIVNLIYRLIFFFFFGDRKIEEEGRGEIQTTNIEHHKGYHLSSQLVIGEIKLIEVLCPFLKLCKNFFINSLMMHNYCKIYFLKKDLYVQHI